MSYTADAGGQNMLRFFSSMCYNKEDPQSDCNTVLPRHWCNVQLERASIEKRNTNPFSQMEKGKELAWACYAAHAMLRSIRNHHLVKYPRIQAAIQCIFLVLWILDLHWRTSLVQWRNERRWTQNRQNVRFKVYAPRALVMHHMILSICTIVVIILCMCAYVSCCQIVARVPKATLQSKLQSLSSHHIEWSAADIDKSWRLYLIYIMCMSM